MARLRLVIALLVLVAPLSSLAVTEAAVQREAASEDVAGSIPGPTHSHDAPGPGDYCTFATCAPRRSSPLVGSAGFAAAAVAAAYVSRQRSEARRA